MGVELDTPNLEKNPSDGKNNLFRYGINTVQGLKKSLEVYNINNTMNITQEKKIYIFGILDGHSGNEISQYISKNFCKELSKNENFNSQNYQKALIETFIDIDKSLRKEEINYFLKSYSNKNKSNLKEKLNDLGNVGLNEKDLNEINNFMDILDPNNLEEVLISDYVGCSGLIILIEENNIYIANAGNSHFIIINKNLEINNKIEDTKRNQQEEEKKRVRIAKGFKYGKKIEEEEYDYTRGFGDYQYKTNNLINIESPEILSEPFLYEINNRDIKYLIAFNNGFYENYKNYNSSEQNNKIIYKKIASDFIELLKDEEKNISDIIGDYFDKIISNNQNIVNNNVNQNGNNIYNNLSCVIIEFFS